jgi:sulfite reductase alpha subunit
MTGCANDCMNSIERSDFATIGTWRDDIKINQDAWKAMVADKGMDYIAHTNCYTFVIACC